MKIYGEFEFAKCLDIFFVQNKRERRRSKIKKKKNSVCLNLEKEKR